MPLSPYNRMQMHPASEQHIPDGLLAANALLSENSHQGSATSTHTLHQGFGLVISHTSLGIIGPLYDSRIRSRSTGKERDQESGLDYFGARYYASPTGRFQSPDWSAQEEPVPYSKLDNPQTLNLYSYVLNNPLRNLDSDGHVVVDKGVTYVYYPVTGATADEAIANSNTHFDGQFSGQTTPTFTVEPFAPIFTQSISGGNDTVTATAPSDDKITTTVSQTIQLPSWKSSDPVQQAAFDKSTGQLKQHEEIHAADNLKVADKLDKSIPGTSASATNPVPQTAATAAAAKLTTKLGDKVNGAYADATQRAKTLDDKTHHGTQP